MVQDRSSTGTPAAKPGAKPSAVSPSKKKDDLAKDEETKEIGGRDGPDPTRFGDWENKGRCVDF